MLRPSARRQEGAYLAAQAPTTIVHVASRSVVLVSFEQRPEHRAVCIATIVVDRLRHRRRRRQSRNTRGRPRRANPYLHALRPRQRQSAEHRSALAAPTGGDRIDRHDHAHTSELSERKSEKGTEVIKPRQPRVSFKTESHPHRNSRRTAAQPGRCVRVLVAGHARGRVRGVRRHRLHRPRYRPCCRASASRRQ